MLVQYGELYHAAWKRSAGPVLRALEHDCVQDLANHCIHAASPALASALRRVLGAFHQHKKFRAVDELLHRVYEPILWRALRVANAAVRRQAALLFVDAFPVQDPDAANADFEQARRRAPRRRAAPPNLPLPLARFRSPPPREGPAPHAQPCLRLSGGRIAGQRHPPRAHREHAAFPLLTKQTPAWRS